MGDLKRTNENLKRSQAALESSNRTLETRIAERTASLREEVKEKERAQAEMRKSKEVAESATAMKSQFLANMSHEVSFTSWLSYYSVTDLNSSPDSNTFQRCRRLIRPSSRVFPHSRANRLRGDNQEFLPRTARRDQRYSGLLEDRIGSPRAIARPGPASFRH